jgi:hypothetical protein
MSVNARANGGPVSWTGPTPAGSIQPHKNTAVKLNREDLLVTLAPNGNNYSITALYELENTGLEESVEFGVPILVTGDEEIYSMETAVPVNVEKAAASAEASVKISLEGKEHPCVFKKYATELPGRIKAGTAEYTPKSLGWCVAKLTFPKEKKVSLKLRYTGELWFKDMIYSKSALREFDDRIFYYPLFPAAYWKTNPEALSVTVEPGPYKSARLPPGAKMSDGTWKWEIKNPDFLKTPDITIFLGRKIPQQLEMLGWNKNPDSYSRPRLSAKASSGNSAPGSVLDGRGDTAWCADNKPGAAKWIELRSTTDYYLPTPEYTQYCSVERILLSPGHLKSDAEYLDHGRVKKIRVSSCEKRNIIEDVAFPALSGRAGLAVEQVAVPGNYEFQKGLFKKKGDCLRFEILEIIPGLKYNDACISEIGVVINCG